MISCFKAFLEHFDVYYSAKPQKCNTHTHTHTHAHTEVVHNVMVIIVGDSLSQVQILDEAVSISLCTNGFGNGIYPSLLLPVIDKRLGQAVLYFQNLILYYILLMMEELNKHTHTYILLLAKNMNSPHILLFLIYESTNLQQNLFYLIAQISGFMEPNSLF